MTLGISEWEYREQFSQIGLIFYVSAVDLSRPMFVHSENSLIPPLGIAVIRECDIEGAATPFSGEQTGERSTNIHGSLEYQPTRNDLRLSNEPVLAA